jgi:hypothetical protein
MPVRGEDYVLRCAKILQVARHVLGFKALLLLALVCVPVPTRVFIPSRRSRQKLATKERYFHI